MSAQMLEVLGARTMLRLEKDAWSMINCLAQATNDYPLTPPRPLPTRVDVN